MNNKLFMDRFNFGSAWRSDVALWGAGMGVAAGQTFIDPFAIHVDDLKPPLLPITMVAGGRDPPE